MAFEVIMPKAGMAMEEGRIIKWFKQKGEKVEAGEPLIEIETDKVSMEVEATASGVLLKILNNEGDVVPVTQIIAYIGEPGEKIEESSGSEQQGVKTNKNEDEISNKELKVEKKEVKPENSKGLKMLGSRIAATPLAKTIALKKGIDLRTVTGTGSFGEIKSTDVMRMKTVSATPLAKRIAEDKNIDITRIQGSGFNGKIRKEDLGLVKSAVEKVYSAEQKTDKAAVRKVADEAARKPLKGMRKVIADRMLKSHLEIPPVTLNAKADVTELISIRRKINTALGTKISINDFILKAVATALEEMPNINASLEGHEIVFKTDVNVGMAVALDDGLIVPVIKNADTLSLRQISKKSKELASKAREGRLMPDDYTGGTFTVSNLGMYDVISFTPIINQPEIAIMGVCAIENELKMVEDKIENRSMMGLSLTFDHRAVDGAQAALFLKRTKNLLQNPLEMLA